MGGILGQLLHSVAHIRSLIQLVAPSLLEACRYATLSFDYDNFILQSVRLGHLISINQRGPVDVN